jgi:D-beta-D-heptose 7-phosphate kinase/D-beta-D-heptose 1-phosphate adenosyltransferase
MDNIVVVTGGFDPIHSGHIAYINEAAKLGRVVVGLNSDEWLNRKKGAYFMPFSERYQILQSLKNVMCVIDFNDLDSSACHAITKVKTLFPNNSIIFANGGDRDQLNTPEMLAFKNDPQVQFMFAIGGSNKINSSSWILDQWKNPAETRLWGKFLTYYNSSVSKVKRLVIDPGKSISMQYHKHRSELWFVEYGTAEVSTLGADGTELILKNLATHEYHHVPANTWHKLKNIGTDSLSIIEIQYGSDCCELDITRHG